MVGDPQALTRLARLRAEVAVDAQALTARSNEVKSLLAAWRTRSSLSRADLMLVAVNLHGYYTALETLLERVARLLDESVPSGPTWHVDLLAQMQVEVPGLRPAVIDPAQLDDLHELRKFRHFFRNAYLLDLDPQHVLRHGERLERIHPAIARSIGRFRDHVEAAVARLARPADG
jgi:hypothetical protein